jgi:hypothetical protein
MKAGREVYLHEKMQKNQDFGYRWTGVWKGKVKNKVNENERC